MSRGSPAWFLATLALASVARADGFFVWKNEQIDIHEPEQKVLIVFDEGVEDLVLSVKFEGAPKEFGWIVPLPSVPDMFPEDILLFEELSRATQMRQFWRSERGARLNMSMGGDAVQVVKTETVGIYESTILRADNGGALRDWLKKHGFRLPHGSEKVLGRYAKKGWVFAALRIQPPEADSTRAQELASGTIQPVRFRFKYDEPVFPLEVSSLGRHPSTVLLYVLTGDAVVPQGAPPGVWESQVYSQPRRALIRGYWFFSRAADPSTAEPLFTLTKHRATFSPRDMRDIRFGPYDPGQSLRSEDEATRIEAVTHIGMKRLKSHEAGLLNLLSHARPGRETYATLWALGEIGGTRTEAALLERLEDLDPDARLEAIEALAAMKSKRALHAWIRGFAQSDVALCERWRLEAIQRACFDHVLERGDASCEAALRELAISEGGAAQWTRVAANDGRGWCGLVVGRHAPPGALAVAALAAQGYSDATETIVESLVSGGRCTEEAALRESACLRGSVNGFPRGFWTGLLTSRGFDTNHPWCSFALAHNLYESVPATRNRIYRLVAADDRLPDAGRVVLLGNLTALTDADVAQLLAIWQRATMAPVYLDVPGPERVTASGAALEGAYPIRFNANACCVAYAFGRHRRKAELLKILQEAPAQDYMLLSEIQTALAEVEGRRPRGWWSPPR